MNGEMADVLMHEIIVKLSKDIIVMDFSCQSVITPQRLEHVYVSKHPQQMPIGTPWLVLGFYDFIS